MAKHSEQQPHSLQPGASGWTRFVAWVNIALQAVLPIAATLSPNMAAQAQEPVTKLCRQAKSVAATKLYTLKAGETLASVAQKYNINVAALEVLNANRHFPKGFYNVKAGDVIEVPNGQFSQLSVIDSDCLMPNDANSQKLAALASEAGSFFSQEPNSQETKQKINSIVASQAGQELESWLGRYGTARVQLNADSGFDLENSQIDLLVPLYDDPADLVFTQGSVHRTDRRNQANFGFGWRHFRAQDMYGTNTFFDYDFTRQHARLGLGVEYWRDYLKLSANAYRRLTSWKDTDDLKFQDRPANGWDVRAEAYLPSYPQLGGKLIYEKYYGDEVALFNEETRQKNPYAVTADISYTPFPLMTLTAEHRRGREGANDSSFGVMFNYQLGVPWSQQVDTRAVKAYRSLMGSRYSLVDRNNNIVLEYRKKEVVRLSIASMITGYGGQEKSLEVSASAPSGIDRIEWTAPELLANGGKIVKLGPSSYNVILPNYQTAAGANNTYTVTAIAYDKDGNASQPQQTQITVLPSEIDQNKSSFTPAESTIVADAKSTQTLTLKVVDANNQPVDIDPSEIQLKRNLSADHGLRNPKFSAFKRVEAGVYQVVVTAGTRVLTVELTPVARKITFNSAKVHIKADESTAQITKQNIRILKNNAVDDGKAQDLIEITVTDAEGNVIPNEMVTFKANNGAKIIGSAKTNDKGVIVVPVTNTLAGLVDVTAQVGDSTPVKIQVNFAAEDNTAQILASDIKVIADNAVADNKAQNKVQVKVTNAHGEVLANEHVSFSVNNHATLSSNDVVTDANGIATVSITSQTAGKATVTASVAKSQAKADVTFIANQQTATIVEVVPSAGPYIADGQTPVTYQAIVKDANGNLLKGVSVNWRSDQAAIKMNTQQSTTNENGVALLEITSTKALTVVITAATNNSSKAAPAVTFVADRNNEILSNLAADKMTFVANNQDKSTLTATITDRNGNPVDKVNVSWQATNGATLTPLNQITDANGQVQATVNTITAGSIDVTAKLDNGQSQQLTLVAKADVATQAITLAVDKSTAHADNRDRIKFTATVKDQNGNPVTKQTVNWQSSLNNLSAQSATTDENGEVSVLLKGPHAGEATVTATLADGKSAQQTVEFTALNPDNKQSTFVIEPKQVVADGRSAATGTLTLRDANGNPVTGQAVIFKANNSAVHFSAVTEENNGIYRVQMTSTKAGTFGVQTSVSAQPQLALNGTVIFIADDKSAQIQIQTDKNSLIADNRDQVEVTATVVDANGNPLSGEKVTWRATNGASLTANADTTDAKGLNKAIIKTTTSGEINVTAALDNGKNDMATINAKGDINTATVTLKKSKPSAKADGQDSIYFIATVKDANNNPLAEQTVTFKTTLNKLSATSVVTSADGHASVTLSGTKAGAVTVTAVLQNNQAAQQNAEFTALAPDQKQSRFVIDPAQIVADGTTTATGTVTIKDQNGNPVTGQRLKFSTSDTTVRFTNIVESGNGQYTVQISGTKAGAYTIKAQLADDSSFSLSAPLTLVADEDSSQIIAGNLTIVTNGAVADGRAQDKVQAIVTDSNGNRVANQTVKFSADNGATITPTVTTNANGEAQTVITSTKAGNVKVTAQVGQSSARNVTVNFVANGDTAQIADGDLRILSDRAIANGQQHDIAQVKVTDANGNPVSNIAVSFTVDQGATLSSNQVTTGDDGLAMVYITSLKAVTANLTATVKTSQQSAAIHFIGDENAAHVISVTPSAGPYIADGKTAVTYQTLVQDNNGNPLPGLTVAWHADNSDVVMSATRSDTNAQGIATITITSTKAVTVVMMAQVNASHKAAQPITFVADRSQAVVSTLTTDKQSFKADNQDSVTATAMVTDSNGNPIANMKVNWQVTNGATTTPASATTDNTGKAQTVIKTTKAGAITITAALDNGQSKTANVTAQADISTAKITLTADKDQVAADGQQLITFSATVTDANNNLLANQSVEWQSSLNKLSAQSSDTNAQGIATVTLSGTKAGQAVVNATLANGQSASKTVTFTALTPDNKQSSFYIMPQHVVADGKTTATGTITVRDINGNRLTGQQVTVQAADSALTISDVSEEGNGVYKVQISSTKAGSFNVTATIGETSPITLKASATFDADPSTAKFTFVTVVPPSTVIADGKTQVKIRAQLSDSQGNTGLNNVKVNWATNFGKLSASSSQTNSAGIAEITISSTTPGSAQVTATLDNGSSQAADKTITFKRDVSGDNSTLTLDRDTIAAGSGVAIATITAKSSSNQPLTGLADLIQLHLMQSLPLTIGKISETSPGVYQAELRGNKAGVVTLSATIDGVQVKQTAKLTVVADTASARIKNIEVDTPTAFVGDKATYTATVVDANDNIIHDPQTITWTANSDSSLGSAQTQTDANGKSKQTVTRTLVGVAKVQASIGNQAPVNAPDVTVKASSIDYTQSTVTLNPTTILANGKDNAVLTITLKDKYGNLVDATETVTATANLKGVTLSAATRSSTGVYLITITGTSAGTAQIQAFIGDSKLQAPQTLILQADKASWQIVGVTVSKHELIAGEAEGVKYLAMVVDQNGDPVEGATVTWQELSGPQSDYPTSSVTNQEGGVQMTLHSNQVGIVKMQASLESGQYKWAPDVNVIAAAPDMTKSTFTADTLTITANGQDKVTFTAHIQDRFGNPITGQQVQIGLPNQLGGFDVNPMTMTDVGNGDYTAVGKSVVEGVQRVEAFSMQQKIGEVSITVKAAPARIYFEQTTVTTTYTRLYYQAQGVIGVPGGVKTTWSSSDDSVASVNVSNGQVTLHKAGTTVITVETDPESSFGYATASYTLIVEKEQPNLVFTYDAGHSIAYGTQFTLPTVMTTNNDIDVNTLELTRTSSDESVATIAQDNRLTIYKAGHVTLTVTSAETDQFKSASVMYDLEITKRQLTITFPESHLSFNQEQMENNPTIYKLNPIENIPDDVKLVWSSSDTNVLNINSADGSLISHTAAGETTISATVVEDERYMPATGSYDVEIYGRSDIELSSIIGYSLGQASDATKQPWQPFTQNDKLEVTWKLPEGESQYQYPSMIKFFLETVDGTTLVYHDYRGDDVKGKTVRIDPNAQWVGQRLRVRIEAYDEAQQLTDTVKRNIQISAIDINKVISSATAKVSHQVYRTGQNQDSVDANVCRVDTAAPQDAVYAEWEINIDSNRDAQRSIFDIPISVYMVAQDGKTGQTKRQLVHSSNAQEVRLQNRVNQPDANALLTGDCWGSASSNGQDRGTVTMEVDVTYGGKTFKLMSQPMTWNADSSASNQSGTNMTIE